VVLGGAVLAALVARGADGDPLLPDRLHALEPAEAGTYRMVGTERDSRTGRTVDTSETFTVEPWFEVNGVEHQITRMGDAGEWETEFRPDGTHRVRESAAGVSWAWDPPLRTYAAPLGVGTTWTSRSEGTVPDAEGFRRLTTVEARTEVADAATVDVAGRRVRTYVLEAWVRTTVTSTNRVDRSVTAATSTTEGRLWFSPEHMLVVRSDRTTSVDGGVGGERYELVRRLALERRAPT
jgi:hypothetical protein